MDRITEIGAARMLKETEAMRYCGLGRTHFREWAKEIGARRCIGRSVRYDIRKIDAALDQMAAENETGE